MNANASTIAKTIVDTLDIAKLAIKEVEDLLDHLDEEDLKAAGTVPADPKLNKRGQRLLAMLQEPGGAHIDRLADELCVERESVRSLISKVTRRVGLKAECHNGVYTLTDV